MEDCQPGDKELGSSEKLQLFKKVFVDEHSR